MRVAYGRRVAFGLMLVPLIGMVALAQLPPPLPVPASPAKLPPVSSDKLKADTAALAAERKAALDDGNGERARLQAELRELLKRVNSLPTNPGPTVKPVAPPPKKFDPLESSTSIDALRTATNLFESGDFESSHDAFRYILTDPTRLSREDRAFAKYMMACCLRRTMRSSEAAVIYREVSSPPIDDEFIASCAIWQLSLMRSSQELEAQLRELRARAKSK